MNCWRLVSDLDAYVYPNTNSVVLVSVEKKSDRTKALAGKNREGSQYPIEISLASNEFRLSFSDDLTPRVQCDEFPNSSQWYEVKNFVHLRLPGRENNYLKEIKHLIDFQGLNPTSTFEAAFSDEFPGEVRFTAEGMDDYSLCFNEMTRRLNCTLHRKTKKYVVGHRYDIETGTYYFLGDFLGRKENLYSSLFFSDVARLDTHYYLFVRDIEGCKTVSDVFKKVTFGTEETDIYISNTAKPMVDSGQVLQDDVTDIQNLWPEMLDLAIRKTEEGKTSDCVFSILSYFTPGHVTIKDEVGVRNKLKPFLDKKLNEVALTYWDLGNMVKDNCKMRAGQANGAALFDLFCTYECSGDGNSRILEYYTDLFTNIGIDINALCSDIGDKFNGVNEMHKDFNLYLKQGKIYFKYHKQGGELNIIRKKDDPHSTNTQSIDEIYGGELAPVIVKIAKNAIKTYGNGIKEFKVFNLGNKKTPKLQYYLTISIQDILALYGNDPDKVPVGLQEGIMGADFWTVKIITDQEDALT